MKSKLLLSLYIIITIINIILLIKIKNEPQKIENYKIVETTIKKDNNYDNTKKYYKELKYKEFKELYNDNNTHNIAIIGNKTLSEKRFREYINLLNYYKGKTIFLLKPNKLNKKNQAKFYNLNKDLIDENNIIVKINNKKVISKTIIKDDSLSELIEELK